MAIKKFNAVQGFSVGDNDTIYDVINSDANVTANNLTVNGTTHLGSISNVSITGGTSGYVLRTDGAGGLNWENPAGVGVVGSNTQVQFNDGGLFGASANFTFNKSTKTLTTDYIIANGIGLTDVAGANVSGTVANATYSITAGTVTVNAQPNITSVGTLVRANITGNISSGNATLGNMAIANYFTGTLVTSIQPNITSVGTLDSLSVDGAGSITGANLVSGAYLSGTLVTKAQPNITSVGTLVRANITGNISSGNANLGNMATANYFSGDGSLLTAITGANVTGTVADATTAVTAGTVTTGAQPNITSVGTLVRANITGNISSGNANLGNMATANYFSGNGVYITHINGANVFGQVANALIANTVTDNAQPNITSVGTLSGLTVSGDTTINGNVTVSGTFQYANVSSFRVKDPLIEQGGSTSGSALTNNDGYDRGQILHYYSGAPFDAFMGWDNSNAEFALGSVVTVTNDVVTFNTFGNLRAGYYYGNASQLTGIIANANFAAYSSIVTSGVQPNITSLGTLTSLNVSGNVAASNANLGNLVTANYFTGDGGLLSNIVGGNVTGQVSNALVAGTVYTRAQPNITSVGTLVSANVSGNITSGGNVLVTANVSASNANLGNLVTANYFTGDGGYLSNITGANVTGTVSTATTAATVTTNAQPNITSVGTLVSANVSGNISSGNANLGNLATANYFTGNGSLLTNLNGSNITSQVSNALIAGTVYTNAQPNITSLGTLSNVNVSGNITSGGNVLVTANISSGNANLGNLATANYFTGNGSLLTSLNGSNVTGQVSNALIASTVYTNAQPNITSVGTLSNVNVSGNVTSGGNVLVTANVSASNANLGNLVTANYFSGAGNLLSNIVGGNVTGQVSNALIAGTVYSNDQPNITSVGTLNGLTISGDATVSGNLTVSGAVEIANVTTFRVKDPIIEQGGNTTGTALSSNDGYDRGQLLHYYSGTAKDAFMGWDNSNAEFAFGSNVTVASEVVSFVEFGNVRAGYFLGNGSQLTGTIAFANYASYAGNVTVNAQPNITSVGSLSGLTVSNASGTVNFVTTANVSLGAVANLHISGGTSGYILQTDGSGSLTWVSPSSAGIAGSNTQIQFNDSGSLGATANFTFNKATNLLSVTGNVRRNGANLMAFSSATTAPSNPVPGDEWYDQVNDIIYKYITDGVSSYWIDITSGYLSASVTATANTLVQRDASGNITANYFKGDGSQLTGVGSAGGLANGTSNITAGTVNGNITVGVAGVSNTVVFTSTGMNVIATGGINAGNLVTANYFTGTLTTGAQPNITSLGTLASTTLAANANITMSGSLSQITGANLVTANYHSGNGSLLTSITGANVTGTVANATYATTAGSATTAATVTTAAQPNITSVGTLVSTTMAANATLTLSGTASQISGANLISGTYLTGTLTTGAQPNITSVGTLVSANVTGNISSGNANLGNLVTANYFTGNGSLLTSITGANITGTVANANYAAYAGNVVNAVQSNITSVGTLANLNIAGNVTSGSGSGGTISGANLVSANYFTGTLTTGAQPNITSVGTLAGVTATGVVNLIGSSNVSLGSNTNVHITGGTSGQYLQTDGSGGLSWATIATASLSNGTSNVSIPTVNGNVIVGVGGNTTITVTTTGANVSGYLNVTGNTTAANANLGNLVTANYFTGVLTTGAQPNITSLGTLVSLTSGLITATSGGVKVGNIQDPSGTNTISLASGNVTMLGNLQVGTGGTGNVTATYFIGNGATLTSIAGANVTGTVANATYATSAGSATSATTATTAGTVTTAAQPNITSVGTLSGLTVSANITSGNANLGNLVTANYFTGNGSLLTSITGANVTGTVANATYATSAGSATSATTSTTAGTVTTAAQPNITSVGTLSSVTVTGNVTSGNANLGNLVTANYFSGDGSLLSNLQISSATVANANYANFAGGVINSSQPNITSLGSLSSLTVSGDTVITGNLIVTGNHEYTNVTTMIVTDPITEQGGGANGAALSSNDAKDRGQLLHYYTTTPVDAFMGWDSSASEFILGSNVSVTNEVVTVNTYGNLRVGNANLGNLVTANYFTGNGSLLTSITGGNVTGQVANALVAGTVYTNAQPNITSVGTLTSLDVSGNVTAAYLIGNGSQLTGLPAGYANSNVDAYLPTYTGNISGNIVTLTGNVTATNANLGNLVTANFFSGAGNLLSNIVGGNVTGQVSNALIAGTVYTNAQPNITSVGTLTTLDVTGNITSGANVLGKLFNSTSTVLHVPGPGNVTGERVRLYDFANPSTTNYAIGVEDHYIWNAVDDTTAGFKWYGGNVLAATLLGNGQFTTVGNITAVNANLGNLVTANFFSGAGNLLSNIVGGNVTGQVANALVAGTVYTNAQPNITSVGTLSGLTVSGITNLGSASNLKLTGGGAGYSLVTDGTGNLSWASTSGGSGPASFVSVAKDNFVGDGSTNGFVLSVTPSSVQSLVVNINGLVQQSTAYSLTGSTVSFASAPLSGVKIEVTTFGVVGLTGTATQVQYNNGSGITGSSEFTFNDTTNALSVTGNITSGGNLVATGGYVTLGTGIIAVSSGNAGIFTSGIGNINIGLAGNVTMGGTTSNTTVRGNLVANAISSNSTITGDTITATNLKMNDLYSNRTPINVTGTTVIDSFALNKYRTAKYTIRVGSDDGYQSIEVLLIHDGLSSHITVYGSISTSGFDIVLISSAINSGNVELSATTSSANTTVNLIGTYVAD